MSVKGIDFRKYQRSIVYYHPSCSVKSAVLVSSLKLTNPIRIDPTWLEKKRTVFDPNIHITHIPTKNAADDRQTYIPFF